MDLAIVNIKVRSANGVFKAKADILADGKYTDKSVFIESNFHPTDKYILDCAIHWWKDNVVKLKEK